MSETNDPAASFTRDQSSADSSLSPRDTFPAAQRQDAAPPSIPGYAIDAVLGRGGMGVVYRGTQTLLRRPAAIKVLLGGGHAGAQAVARLKAEAATVAALDHPNVVRVYDAGETNGVPYLAMELAPAGSLEDRLKGKPLPLAAALAVMRAVATGVGAAHALGIVHRDLKPANVLFAADGTPKVADFGLAKSADTDAGLTATGSVLGTVAYMSPEQALGKTKLVGLRADVWAIGVMLYECLTGAVPFVGESLFDTLDKVRQGKVVPPRKLNPAIPPAVEEVVLKCLRRLPEERYADAGEVAAALAEEVRPAAAPPANRKLVIGLGAAVVVLMAAVAAMALRPRDAEVSVLPVAVTATKDEPSVVKPPPIAPSTPTPKTAPPVAVPAIARRRAVVFGQHLAPPDRPLFGPLTDAAKAMNLALDRAGFRPQQFAGYDTNRPNGEAGHIVSRLGQLAGDSRDDDLTVVYLHGHGVLGRDFNVPADLGFGLVTYNTGVSGSADRRTAGPVLTGDQLLTAVAGLRGAVLLLVDADHAGDLCDRSTHPRLAVLAGCGPAAKRHETAAGGSLFTGVLARGLGGAADADRDRAITLGELSRFVTDQVPLLRTRVVGTLGDNDVWEPQQPRAGGRLPADTLIVPAGATAPPVAEPAKPPPSPPAPGTAHALLVIGANDRDPLTAATLAKDLTHWKEGLAGLVPKDNLRVVHWSAAKPVTADRVRTELADLARRAGPADTVMATFVGNGRSFGGRPAFVFYDLARHTFVSGPANVLAVDEVTEALAGGRARASLVFWDVSRKPAEVGASSDWPPPSPTVAVHYASKDGRGAHEDPQVGSVFSRAATTVLGRVAAGEPMTAGGLAGRVAAEYRRVLAKQATNPGNDTFDKILKDPADGPEVVGGPPAATPLFVRE